MFLKSGKVEVRTEGHGVTELLAEFCELKSNSDFGGLGEDILAYEVQHKSYLFLLLMRSKDLVQPGKNQWQCRTKTYLVSGKCGNHQETSRLPILLAPLFF